MVGGADLDCAVAGWVLLRVLDLHNRELVVDGAVVDQYKGFGRVRHPPYGTLQLPSLTEIPKYIIMF